MALKWFPSLTLNTLLLLQKQTTLFVPIESLTTGQWGSKFLIGYCFFGKDFLLLPKVSIFFFTTPLWNVKETIPSISWLINPLIVWPPFWYQIILWLFFHIKTMTRNKSLKHFKLSARANIPKGIILFQKT